MTLLGESRRHPVTDAPRLSWADQSAPRERVGGGLVTTRDAVHVEVGLAAQHEMGAAVPDRSEHAQCTLADMFMSEGRNWLFAHDFPANLG